MIQMSFAAVTSGILRNSSGGMIRPVGLFGEFMINSRALGPIALLTARAVKRNPSGSVSIIAGRARQNFAISGNVTQYGDGISTSSPGFSSVAIALKIA